MKLKSLPSDFQVIELTHLKPSGGPFSLYQLDKESLGTPEAISAVLHNWNLPRQRISYGGMKDRHARTSQFITIHGGPKQDLQDRSFSLKYLGQTPRPFTPQDISGNQFSITLRGIQPDWRAGIEQRLTMIQSMGVVNYFDDQRFGSLGQSRRFIAEPWCKGDYEQALYLALAEFNSHDRPREREQKVILRDLWGQWQACKDQLDRSHRRSIVTFLVDHPTNFKRAIALLRIDLRSIYLAAFQSGLWNRWLSQLIVQRCSPAVWLMPSAVVDLAMPIVGDCQPEQLQWLRALRLPLPTARQHDWPEEHTPMLDAILQEYGLERREIRLKFPRDTFFSKGVRDCWLSPLDFWHQWSEDELHAGQLALDLSFGLPRGAYATMIVKVLQVQTEV